MSTALATFMNANPGLGPVESLGELILGNPSHAYDIYALKSDTVDLTNPTKCIYVGVAGDVKVDMVGSGTVVFKAMPLGMYRLQVKRLYSTGTTSTNVMGLY
jgi:hypothetical protein